MTQEEKQLLLVDLSARFPYNVAIDCRDEDSRFTCYLTTDILREIQNNNCYWEYKPYLFPMSSMTEEQRKELFYLSGIDVIYGNFYTNNEFTLEETLSGINWLLKNHFDINGLIPMGLALDAKGLNIY